MLGKQKGRREHHGEQPVPHLLRKLLDRGHVLEPGVVDQDVEGSISLQHFIHYTATVLAGLEVGTNKMTAQGI
jgi:hypothetical protein